MKKYYVTISRQFGSLGRSIANELSELLGIEYYDTHDALLSGIHFHHSFYSHHLTFSSSMVPLAVNSAIPLFIISTNSGFFLE